MKTKNRTFGIKAILETEFTDRRGNRVSKRLKFKKRIPIGMPLPKGVAKKAKKMLKCMGMLTLCAVAVMMIGCAPMSYAEPEEVMTVSALGFDLSAGGVRVSVQTAEKGGESVRVIKGEGESVSFALAHLEGGESKRMELSHCAVIVLGDGVEGETLREVMELCERDRDITDAVLIVATHDAGALLSLDGAAGFELASTMRPSAKGKGLFSENRFYEIKNEEDTGVMALPYFFVSGDEYRAEGLKLYDELYAKTLLDSREGALYLITRGIYSAGRLDHYRYGQAVSAEIKSSRTRYYENGEGITVRCCLTVGEDMSAEEKSELAESCRVGLAELYDELTSRYGDIYALGDGVSFPMCSFVLEVK